MDFSRPARHCVSAVFVAFLSYADASAAPPEYWQRWHIDASGNGADGVDTADFNRDGLLDVVSGWEQSGDIKLYLNPGAARLQQPAAWQTIDISGGLHFEGIEDAAFIDLNLDGFADAVVASSEGDTRALAIQWQTAAPYNIAQNWRGTVLSAEHPAAYMKARAGQLDGVNGADIVAGTKASKGEPSRVYWFKSPTLAGPDNAAAWQRFAVGENDTKTVTLLIRDMDGDGLADIVSAGRQGVAWFKNPGPAALAAPATSVNWEKIVITATGSEFTFCNLGPGQGDDIIAATSKHSGMLAMWLKRLDASGRHWAEYPIRGDVPRPDWTSWDKFVLKGVACGFVDGDERIDVVFTASGDGHGVFMLSPRADIALGQNWGRVNITPFVRGMKYDNLQLADIDDDGDLDIVTSEEGEGTSSRGEGVLWFENPLK